MNKKRDPETVRSKQRTVWMTNSELKKFLSNVEKSNLKESDFMRQMITEGYVQAARHRMDKEEVRELRRLLLEYRTHFKRISNFMKYSDPKLASEVIATAAAIQKVIDRV